MTAVKVPINPQALAWALRRARLGLNRLAAVAGVKPDQVQAWLDGSRQPTYPQARKIAHRLRVSLGQLLLPPPADEPLPLPDFRRGTASRLGPSVDLIDTIFDALRKRDWWREYRGDSIISFVGSYDWRNQRPQEVADSIRKQIAVQKHQKEAAGFEDFLRRLTYASEDAGILVLRTSVAVNNNHRPLDPDEIAGFAVADPVAPIIMINTADYVARRNFTFAHELAHIWVGQSAIDDKVESETDHLLERFCDQVAVEVLVPASEFRRVWQGPSLEAAHKTAKRFWVSTWVVVRRAFELGLIDAEEYHELLSEYQQKLYKPKKRQGRGHSYRTLEARNSPLFTRCVLKAALQGELTLRDASTLLNVSIGTFLKHLERYANAIPPIFR